MKKKEELTPEDINLLEHLISLKRLNGDDITKMYNFYRYLYDDRGFICSKCGRVIRNVHDKLKQYYATNFKNN